MGRGRAPCCDKAKVKRGPWSPAEDLRLISFIHKHGHANWRALPKQAGLLRCGKSCRLRWINYLRPDVKRGNFTPEEEETIIKLHNSMGNKWSKIASHFPGRTDNEIKNVWNTHLKKRLMKKDAGSSHENETKSSSTSYSTNSSSSSSNSIMSHEDKNKEMGLEQTKEQSGIDSPSSSYISDFSSLSQVEIPRPKEEMISSMHNFSTDEAFEIPLESDLEAFWSVLDTLDRSKSSASQSHDDDEDCHGSHSVEEKDFDSAVECRKWLKNLEYELGLVGDQSDGDNQEKNMMLQPEVDNGIDCFPIWPSSPQSFGI